ncbi:MAG: hypothetical protein EAZ76_19200 [Nostocales cyanobacterium]|nr:MAG: hypothetical protein EAZ87_24705 [Nostocales cyanobacterium]TAF04804.1 MAG: hypothetical protein EAZ76_19200 [Nostocales cyanobacterium]
MLMLKQIPWLSLTLVFLSYCALGWVISETETPWFVWVILISVILLLLASLTIPWSKIAQYYSTLLKSNLRSFLLTVVAAFVFFLMLAWFRIFLDTLLILSATILAKIDFQTSGYKTGVGFLLTSGFALSGLAVGALLHRLILVGV